MIARARAAVRCLTVGLIPVNLIFGGYGIAYANGAHGQPARADPLTRLEAFVGGTCSPCVIESYSVTALAIPAWRLTGFGPQVANTMARPAEVRFEVVRA